MPLTGSVFFYFELIISFFGFIAGLLPARWRFPTGCSALAFGIVGLHQGADRHSAGKVITKTMGHPKTSFCKLLIDR